MATNSSAIQKKIETLKKGLNNKFITASQKEKIKAQVEKLESQSKALAPKKSTKTATSSSLTRLQKLVKNKKYSVYKGTGVDLKKDSDRPAKAIGKRTSKSGKTYYEYRANRIDVKQPPKEYPKLEKGGEMAIGGKLKELLSKAKSATIKGYDKTKDYTKKQIHEQKRKVALNVIDDTKKKFKDEMKTYIGLTRRAVEVAYAKGGVVGEYKVVPNKRGEGKLRMYVTSDYEMAFTISGSKEEAEKAAQNFVKEHNETHPTATVTKIHPSGQPIKNKDVSYVTKDEIAKFEDGGYMARGGYYAEGGITKDKLIEIEEEFDENEDNNYHSENVVLLARYFGTKEDLKEAKDIWKKHREEGYLNGENSKKRYELSMKLYKNWDKEKEKFGLMEKGGYMADGGVTEKEVVESNAEMVLSQIKAVKHHAEELSSVVSSKSNIEAWVVGKIERASTDLSDITHYLEGNKDKMSMGGTVRYYAHKMDKK